MTRYEITEDVNECGVGEYQVSDVHADGSRTHSYDFETLAEAEECLEELNKINITTKGNNMKKKLISFAILGIFGLTLMFISSPAEARGKCGWFGCGGGDVVVTPPAAKEETRTQSPADKAKQAAAIEKTIADFKAKGIKDIDVINPEIARLLGTDGKTYEERNAELCWKDMWYGRKQIECVNK